MANRVAERAWGTPDITPPDEVLDALERRHREGDEGVYRDLLLAYGVREDELARDESMILLRHGAMHDVDFLPKLVLILAELLTWPRGDLETLDRVMRKVRGALVASESGHAMIFRELLLRRIRDEFYPPEPDRGRVQPRHLRLVRPGDTQ